MLVTSRASLRFTALVIADQVQKFEGISLPDTYNTTKKKGLLTSRQIQVCFDVLLFVTGKQHTPHPPTAPPPPHTTPATPPRREERSTDVTTDLGLLRCAPVCYTPTHSTHTHIILLLSHATALPITCATMFLMMLLMLLLMMLLFVCYNNTLCLVIP